MVKTKVIERLPDGRLRLRWVRSPKETELGRSPSVVSDVSYIPIAHGQRARRNFPEPYVRRTWSPTRNISELPSVAGGLGADRLSRTVMAQEDSFAQVFDLARKPVKLYGVSRIGYRPSVFTQAQTIIQTVISRFRRLHLWP